MQNANGDYATIIRNNRFHYVPSCIILEMMTKVYSQVAMVNLTGNLHEAIPDLLVLLRRLNRNLNVTVESYRNSGIRNFIGDWKEDRLRARKLFFYLMSRLGYLCDLVSAAEKRLVYQAIEDMAREWTSLDQVMSVKCRKETLDTKACLYRNFRNRNEDNWCRIMANIVLYLDAVTEPEKDTYLLLLCYNRIRKMLLSEIYAGKAGSRHVANFREERILSVSDDEVPLTCSSCAMLTDCALAQSDSSSACAGPRQTTRLLAKTPGTGISLKQRKMEQISSMQRGTVRYGM